MSKVSPTSGTERSGGMLHDTELNPYVPDGQHFASGPYSKALISQQLKRLSPHASLFFFPALNLPKSQGKAKADGNHEDHGESDHQLAPLDQPVDIALDYQTVVDTPIVIFNVLCQLIQKEFLSKGLNDLASEGHQTNILNETLMPSLVT